MPSHEDNHASKDDCTTEGGIKLRCFCCRTGLSKGVSCDSGADSTEGLCDLGPVSWRLTTVK